MHLRPSHRAKSHGYLLDALAPRAISSQLIAADPASICVRIAVLTARSVGYRFPNRMRYSEMGGIVPSGSESEKGRGISEAGILLCSVSIRST
jgi:hypothetical protein